MNIQEFAEKLNGRSYGLEIISTEEQQAEELGFVVVFGQSDDLTKFRGAINSEVDCWEGANIYLDKDGLIEECECECKYYQKALMKARKIEALWCKEDDYSWTYKTDIPHATFNIFEDRELHCRGIVFSIKDL